MVEIFTAIKSFYFRFERFNPIIFFFGGFTWDSVTLKRIDALLDNLILLFYLMGLGLLIILVAFVEKDRIKKPLILKYKKWYPLALQFLLGGLFSAYVIFYFKSASLSTTSIFLGLLLVLLIANEFLERRLKNLYLLTSLYFLASFSFFIFFIPVLFKALNLYTFISGGILSLLLVGAILFLFYKKEIFSSKKEATRAAILVGSLFIMLNLFYGMNWIPPVPLSLKFGGVYHHASKSAEGDLFTLRFEQPEWHQFFKNSDDEYHYVEGDTVSCFTAVFAPTKLTEKIFHHWQKYFPSREEWISTDRLGFKIIGYRDGGYRGITRKRHVSEGKWRVDVETERGVLLGRINFNLEKITEKVPLKTIYK